MRIGVIRGLLLVAMSLASATSCGESSGGPTSPDPTGAGTQIQEKVHLVLAGGGQQSGFTGAPLASPVVVRVLDGRDQPVPGAALSFAAAAGGSVSPTQVSTDAAGNARVQWTLGAAAGTQTLQVSGPGGSALTVTATASVPPPPVARVRIQPDSLVLTVGSTGDFSAVALDAQGNVLTGRAVAWTTSDARVAALGSGGSVTGAAQGTAQVTATVEGVTASAPVRVLPPPTIPVARVRIQPDSLALTVGSTGDFSAVALDAQGNVLTGRPVAWASSDPRVAAVGGTGTVTGLEGGTASITATVEGITASATARVRIPPPAAVATLRIQPDSMVLAPGAQGTFSAVARDAQGNSLTGRAVTWTTSNAQVATLGPSGGLVTGRAEGTATVTATSEGVTTTATVRVLGPVFVRVARVRIQPDSLALAVGSSGDFGAVATDAEGNVLTGRAVTWATTSSQVASVGSGGSVTGVAQGTTEITATVEGVTTRATVRVFPVPVARVRIQPDSLVLTVGSKGDFNAVALDAQGNTLTGRAVAWTTSNAQVAALGSGGSVTGVAQGVAQVTATVEGVRASATVRVLPPPATPVSEVDVRPDSLALLPGGSGQLFAVAMDAQGNTLTGRAVAWSSQDPRVATVDGTGRVTGLADGATMIIARVEGITSSASVRVRTPPAPVATLRIQPDSQSVVVGGQAMFYASATDAQGNTLTGRAVTWTTSNAQVATFGPSGGLVTGRAEGTATVTATSEGVTATATVRVRPAPTVPVARVRIQPDSLALVVGSTGDFNAVAQDANGNVLTGRTVTWTTSNSQVAALGSGGSVTGMAQGVAQVTATVEGVTASAPVRVLPPPTVPVARVRIQPDSMVLTVGSRGDFNAVALDAQGNTLTGRTVTWATSDAQVAALGSGGSVTGAAQGVAQVTATVEGVRASATVRVLPPPATPVSEVDVRPDSLALLPGGSGQLFAVAMDAQGNTLTGRAVTWASSDPRVATVDGTGRVTGVADGTVTIIAGVEGITSSATVRVRTPPAPVATLRLQPDSMSIVVGVQGYFYAIATDAQGNTLTGRAVTYTTSNAQVATFGPTGGLVTGRAEGTATVTATSEGVTATATVRVRPAPPLAATVRVVPDTLTMFPGDSMQFRAVALDAQGNVLTGLPVTWITSSSTGFGAHVSRTGMVTAYSEGTSNVRATVNGVQGSATVWIRPAPVSNVRVKLIQYSVDTTGGDMDVSTSPRRVNFGVEFSEAAQTMALRIRSPGGMAIDCGPSSPKNDYKKEFLCVLQIPAGADPGLWRVDRLVVTTNSGTRTFTAGDLDAQQVPGRAFDVLGAGVDRDAPQVRMVVSHGRTSGRFWIRFGLVDHITGVRSASATLRNAATGQTATCQGNSATGALARSSDNYCPFDIPEGGQWRLVSITATDGVGNTATYTPAEIDVIRGLFVYTFLTYDFTS